MLLIYNNKISNYIKSLTSLLLGTNTMFIKDLIEFGLSDKEAKTYVALLELGVATAGEIAKKSDLNRSSTYVVLESLKKQGLVSISGDKNVVHYVATSPEMLLKTAEDMAIKQEEIRKKIDKILPELSALHKDTKHKPRVRVFEGKNGLVSCLEDSLQSKEKLLRVFSSADNMSKAISPEYLESYVKNRIKLGIRMNGIHPLDGAAKKLIEFGPKNFDKSILIPKSKYKFRVDLAIYDDKIGYMSSEKGGSAIIIESGEMADVMKKVFDLAWEAAGRQK